MSHLDDDPPMKGDWLLTLVDEVRDQVLTPHSVSLHGKGDAETEREALTLKVAFDMEDCANFAALFDVVKAAPENFAPDNADLTLEKSFSLHVLVFDAITDGATREELLGIAEAFDRLAMRIRNREMGHPHEPDI